MTTGIVSPSTPPWPCHFAFLDNVTVEQSEEGRFGGGFGVWGDRDRILVYVPTLAPIRLTSTPTPSSHSIQASIYRLSLVPKLSQTFSAGLVSHSVGSISFPSSSTQIFSIKQQKRWRKGYSVLTETDVQGSVVS
ncbi:hypothetical protein D9758_015151 [Tetrapyrgos nigripes]|uniref:Uncharacterized protein n=1 Tax=Tetrapyrgos nigripes TaxID=182062 RepID=A0A8H5FQQ0_9AGAR|nr:hypothetical protein D9758_015151 [Tetrapyrgos nigripes]